jgi:hypothetical protein
MKEKLILKHRGDYDYFLVARTENSESLVACLNPDGYFEQKLSKQNCDEIFSGVDVEKLAEEMGKQFYNGGNYDFENGVRKGFNKAMELNKDKVFTLSDMKRAFNCGRDLESINRFEDWRTFTKFIDSLQPTEIEVEIEMEDKIALDGHTVIGREPKLQDYEFLILRKI